MLQIVSFGQIFPFIDAGGGNKVVKHPVPDTKYIKAIDLRLVEHKIFISRLKIHPNGDYFSSF